MATAQTTHHVTLEVDGTTYGLMVRIPGYKQADITPYTVKIGSGDMRFSDQTVYATLVQEDWSHGFGFREMTDPQGYSHSDHCVDSRFPRMVMLMTKLTDASKMDTGLTIAAARKFIEYGGNVYACTINGVYRWDGAKWVSTGQDTGECHDAIEDGVNLYVSFDGARGRHYNGVIWDDTGQSTFTDMRFFARHGGYMWASDDGLPTVHYTSLPTDDFEGGNDGTGGDPDAIDVSQGRIPITSLCPWNNALYVGKEDGLWQIPEGADLAYQIGYYADQRHSKNFQTMVVWKGNLYYCIKNDLYRQTGLTITNVSAPMWSYDFPYQRFGNYRFLTPCGDFLYVIASENTETGTYGTGGYGLGPYGGGSKEALLCYDGVGWHKLMDIATGGDTVSGMNYTPLNDKLWISIQGTTDKIYYIPLNTSYHMPYPSYETTTTRPSDLDNPHYLYMSGFDAQLSTVQKHFSAASISGIFDSGRTIDAWYSIDRGPWMHLGTYDDPDASNAGIETIAFPASATGKMIHFRFNFQTAQETLTPVMERFILQYLPRPATIYSYEFDILLADIIKELDHTLDSNTSKDLYDALLAARASVTPLTLHDIWNEEHTVYCTAVTWVPTEFESGGSGTPKEVEGYIHAVFVVATNEGV